MNYPTGHIVYWINGQRFENSKGKRDGRGNAEKYCLDNFLDANNIIKFDSRTETNRYEYLLDLEKNNVISNLTHHFLFRLDDEFDNSGGEHYNDETYCADFVYKDNATGKTIVEDVKGSTFFVNSEFVATKRKFDKRYFDRGLYISIVLYKGKEWVIWKYGEAKKSSRTIEKQRAEIKTLRAEKHAVEVANNAKERDIARLKELEAMTSRTSQQEKRYQELCEKYKTL